MKHCINQMDSALRWLLDWRFWWIPLGKFHTWPILAGDPFQVTVYRKPLASQQFKKYPVQFLHHLLYYCHRRSAVRREAGVDPASSCKFGRHLQNSLCNLFIWHTNFDTSLPWPKMTTLWMEWKIILLNGLLFSQKRQYCDRLICLRV